MPEFEARISAPAPAPAWVATLLILRSARRGPSPMSQSMSIPIVSPAVPSRVRLPPPAARRALSFNRSSNALQSRFRRLAPAPAVQGPGSFARRNRVLICQRSRSPSRNECARRCRNQGRSFSTTRIRAPAGESGGGGHPLLHRPRARNAARSGANHRGGRGLPGRDPAPAVSRSRRHHRRARARDAGARALHQGAGDGPLPARRGPGAGVRAEGQPRLAPRLRLRARLRDHGRGAGADRGDGRRPRASPPMRA